MMRNPCPSLPVEPAPRDKCIERSYRHRMHPSLPNHGHNSSTLARRDAQRVSEPSGNEAELTMLPPSSRYGHKFAVWGTVASALLISILSLFCAPARVHESDTLGRDLNLGSSRRLLDSPSSPSPACEDIFKSMPAAIPAQQPDNTSALSVHPQDYNRLYLCQYARSCEGDWPSSVFLPLILCDGLLTDNPVTQIEPDNNHTENLHYTADLERNTKPTIDAFLRSFFVHFLLPPLITLYLYLLFRLLATTADSYFSPALEVFSYELGLPPRFAGATLLALGNGSPDLGSTINAILLWNESSPTTSENNLAQGQGGGGWTMSLGSLTGGGMFVGTIVSGLIVQSCNGIPCRGAFLRDVSMYALSIMAVWHILESKTVTRGDALLLLGMWVMYVSIVLVSDLYHRKVTLPRLHVESKKRRQSLKTERAERLSCLATQAELTKKQNDVDVNELTPLGKLHVYGKQDQEEDEGDLNEETDLLSGQYYTSDLAQMPSIDVAPAKPPRLSVTDRFAMLMSNYDAASVKFDLSSKSSTISNDDSETNTIHNVMHQIHSIRRTSIALPKDDDLIIRNDCAFREEDDEEEVEDTPAAPERLVSFQEESEEESVVKMSKSRSCSLAMVADVYQEIIYQADCYWETNFVKEPSRFERFGFILELPLTVLRTVRLQELPCDTILRSVFNFLIHFHVLAYSAYNTCPMRRSLYQNNCCNIHCDIPVLDHVVPGDRFLHHVKYTCYICVSHSIRYYMFWGGRKVASSGSSASLFVRFFHRGNVDRCDRQQFGGTTSVPWDNLQDPCTDSRCDRSCLGKFPR
eukprot:CCRYP_017282-RA/>CCRYP_017282-RA protein AED:0.04 eAED:0.04 QI:274/1/1/1/1/0.66/3/427/806